MMSVKFYVRYLSNYFFHDSPATCSFLDIGHGNGNSSMKTDQIRVFQDKMLDAGFFFMSLACSPVRQRSSFVSFFFFPAPHVLKGMLQV